MSLSRIIRQIAEEEAANIPQFAVGVVSRVRDSGFLVVKTDSGVETMPPISNEQLEAGNAVIYVQGPDGKVVLGGDRR